MITFAKPCVAARSYDKFLGMLPAIRDQARLAFTSFDTEAREELIAETIANAFVAFVRLVQLGKADVAYATPLAWYAIKQIRSGRRVGVKLNGNDVTSRHAQLTKKITVERLDHYDADLGEWREALIEDRHAGPAEIAASRIDVAAWFRSLSHQQRRVAKLLATGETTCVAAKKCQISAARVSQLRRELQASWQTMQGELVAD